MLVEGTVTDLVDSVAAVDALGDKSLSGVLSIGPSADEFEAGATSFSTPSLLPASPFPSTVSSFTVNSDATVFSRSVLAIDASQYADVLGSRVSDM